MLGSLSGRQRLSLEHALYAVGYERGRTLNDSVFRAVTEGRQRAGYSGCGDLGHHIVARLGHRSSWNNREETGGWEDQRNIAKLLPLARRVARGERLLPGDIYIAGTDDPALTHVGVIVQDEGPITWTADYGQANQDPSTGLVGARLRQRERSAQALGPRRLDYVIRPDDLPTTAPRETVAAWAARLHLDPPRSLGGAGGAWYVAVLAAALLGCAGGHLGVIAWRRNMTFWRQSVPRRNGRRILPSSRRPRNAWPPIWRHSRP